MSELSEAFKKMLEDSTLVWGFWPPNGVDLMQMYVEAFRKLWDNLDEVVDVKIGEAA